VVRRRQAVGSTAELAADDALRAQAVRDALLELVRGVLEASEPGPPRPAG
jgi:hypothetical protein